MRDSTEINKTGEGSPNSSFGSGSDFAASPWRGLFSRAGNFVPAALLVSCCLILYLPSIMYFFSQDDFFFLHRAATIGLDDPVAALRPAGPFLRPLSTTLYFAGMLKLFGLRPEAYHAVSLAIFCATTLLVFRLGNIIFRDRAAGFATALFYLGRGVHFETVSWASGIQDLLMIFFILASLDLYLAAERRGPGFDSPESALGRPGRLVLCALGGLCALLLHRGLHGLCKGCIKSCFLLGRSLGGIPSLLALAPGCAFLVLVVKAAKKPSAEAGEFACVQDQVLLFCHLDGDGGKGAKPGLATDLFAAHPVASGHLGSVPDPYLP